MSARPTDRVGLAIALSLVALVLFDFMGLIIKHLSPAYSAAELSAYRNFFGLIPSFIALYSSRVWRDSGRQWRIRQWPMASVRGLIVAVAQLLFYYSLGQMAFASAATITYSNALFMTALAVPLLGERVGALRWLAVLIGFAGVVMVMGPGRETFSWAAVAPLGAAFLYALAGVMARRMDDDVPDKEKRRRFHLLEDLQSEIVGEINAKLLGEQVEVVRQVHHGRDPLALGRQLQDGFQVRDLEKFFHHIFQCI